MSEHAWPMIEIAISAGIAATFLAGFWAGVCVGQSNPIRPAEQNEAWRREGEAAATLGLDTNMCPYLKMRPKNLTAATFWHLGYRQILKSAQ